MTISRCHFFVSEKVNATSGTIVVTSLNASNWRFTKMEQSTALCHYFPG